MRRLSGLCEEIENRVKTSTKAPPAKVVRNHLQIAVPEAELRNKPVHSALGFFEDLEIFIDDALGRARKAPPHGAVEVPEQ